MVYTSRLDSVLAKAMHDEGKVIQRVCSYIRPHDTAIQTEQVFVSLSGLVFLHYSTNTMNLCGAFVYLVFF